MLRPQDGGGADRMHAVAGELLGRDVLSHLTALRALGQQIPKEVVQPALHVGDDGK